MNPLRFIKNKIVLYIASRYVTYGIQFLNSIIIAVTLGPVYLAIWGFINLILQYLNQLNFGIPHSMNVLLSINKQDEIKSKSLFSTSLYLYVFLSIFIIVVTIILYLSGVNIGTQYNFDKYALLVIIIAILTHFNSLFTNYYRIYNKLGEIMFYQSVIPIVTLIALFIAKGESLLRILLWIMVCGQVLSFGLYLINTRKSISKPDFSLIKLLLQKGFYLFLYNACFYIIMLSTRSFVSGFYYGEFGLFTFSFTLANVIVLLFDSFSFLIYPKIINRFNRAKDSNEIVRILNLIKDNYLTAVHVVMYIFILVYPLAIKLFTEYSTTFKCFALIAMTIVFYSNCFVFSSLLIAYGKEKQLSVIAFITLLLNILFATILTSVIKVSYEYVVLATMLSYTIYNILLSLFSYRLIDLKRSMILFVKDNFPLRLFIPFFLCLVMIIVNAPSWIYLFLLFLFIILNRHQLIGLKRVFVRIAIDSSIIDI